jgi:hypothetical protein
MPEKPSVKAYERKVTAAERFFARSPFASVTMVLRIKGPLAHQLANLGYSSLRQAQPKGGICPGSR